MDGHRVFQIIQVVTLGIGLLAIAGAYSTPYWYLLTVQVSYDHESTFENKDLNVGLFYMDKGAEDGSMIDLIFQQKSSNSAILPPLMRVAQIFWVVGMYIIDITWVGHLMLSCLKYRHVAAELVLAAATTASGLSLMVGTIMAFMMPSVEENTVWNQLPIPQVAGNPLYMLVQVQPDIQINFSLYVAAAGTVIVLVASVFAWMLACQLCLHFENVRYEQLRNPGAFPSQSAYMRYGQPAPVVPYRDNPLEKEEYAREMDL